jgi:large subunit ribosomal protein L14e
MLICVQVLVDNPSEDPEKRVPRHSANLSYMSLTGIVIPKLPLAVGTGALKKKWEEHKVDEKWNSSNFAKSRQRSIRRTELTDFDRYKVMRLKKQVRHIRSGGAMQRVSFVLCIPAKFDMYTQEHC